MLRESLGVEKLRPYDRLAPFDCTIERTVYSWEQAKNIVLRSYRSFSPEVADIVQMFFDNGWIDARPAEGKMSGAHCEPATIDTHPVIVMNFAGSARDVMTLAHELGHGVHQYLAAREQKSELLISTPLTLAETASIFGEMLTFKTLLAEEQDPSRRKLIIAEKLNDMISTVARQIAFHNFETLVHTHFREKGDLTQQDFSDYFIRTQKEVLGEDFEIDEGYGAVWTYIPHFVHVPFYVYAYAYGDYVVNAMFEIYETAPDPAVFRKNCMELFRGAGTRTPSDALRPIGIDPEDPAFWESGVGFFGRMTAMLRQAINEEKTMKAPPQPACAPTAPSAS